MADAKTVTLDGHAIELSRLSKTMYPDEGLTKRDVVEYYRKISEVMLPHMRDRPLSMQRFPDGIGSGGFYEKEAPAHAPEWFRRVTVEVREQEDAQPQLVCDNAASLVFLANQACLTTHIWLSRADTLDHPDKVMFDLDPSGDDFELVRRTALWLRDIVREVGLVPYVMTTGSRGLHVAAPIDRDDDFDTVRAFARDLAQVLAAREPNRLTVAHRKRRREGRLFIDYLRNAYAQTSVTPYSLRALPGAPVGTPLDWDELHDTDLRSQSYTHANIFRRLGQKQDPWRDFAADARALGPARQVLDELSGAPDDAS